MIHCRTCEAETIPDVTIETQTRSGARRDPAMLREVIVRKLTYDVGRSQNAASDREWFMATARAVRELIVDRWMATTRSAYETGRGSLVMRGDQVPANTVWQGNPIEPWAGRTS